MTISEAQQFVGRWRRILIPWRAHTDAEAVRDMERSCIGMTGGMALVIICAFSLPSDLEGLAALAVVVMGFAFWLSRRLRQIRRLFDAAGAQSFTELLSHKPPVR